MITSVLRIWAGLLMSACLFSISITANAGEAITSPSGAAPPINYETNYPEMISESSWSDGNDVIMEREFILVDRGNTIHLKRRYKKLTEDKYQLIWRSVSSEKLDARYCAYTQSLPMNDGDTLTIRKNNGYTLICHHPKEQGQPAKERSDKSAGLMKPEDVVFGNQYYRFDDGTTSVQAGSHAVAKATGYYGVKGVGQVTIEFYSYAASCGATNTSNINSPSSLFESYISAFLNCTVTTTPGYYAFHVEGCALGPPLCDAQDYVTTVY